MAVEYETTTPSTPGNPNPNTMFPLTGSSVKKRVMKHTNQENFRAGLFFCGKRKRSHRDRYHDYDHYRLHSSSVPRQREFFTPKNSYFSRNRNVHAKPCERILPLNKNIVSKIEKISQESLHSGGGGTMGFSPGIVTANDDKNATGFTFESVAAAATGSAHMNHQHLPDSQMLSHEAAVGGTPFQATTSFQAKSLSIDDASGVNSHKMPQKSGSFDSPFNVQDSTAVHTVQPTTATVVHTASLKLTKENVRKSHGSSRHSNHKRKQSKRSHLKQVFHEQNGMDCGNLNDFLSSSSLSSSDSEAGETNESDREGDDELTDWPGNEAMVNFASKNDFKRAKSVRGGLANATNNLNRASVMTCGRYTNDESMGQDEDTLMSADELPLSCTSHLNASQIPNETNILLSAAPNIFPSKFSPSIPSRLASNDSPALSSPSTSDNPLTSNTGTSRALRNTTSLPIDIIPPVHAQPFGSVHTAAQIESEMSGETSNHFLSSPNVEVREIRAGCRRIRNERPGFTIFSSVNEHLSRCVSSPSVANVYIVSIHTKLFCMRSLNFRFLQDSRQSQLILPYTNSEENDKLIELAKLYSLRIEIENSRAIFYKTM